MNVIGFREARCKNCYKCVRICDVKAIVVKDQQAQIRDDLCILCGHCLDACPQNAKTLISDLDRVKEFIRTKKRTVISLAPSYLGIMKFEKIGQVVTALKQLGFSEVRETSEGAAYVTREYVKLLNEGKMRNIITTCCPSANDLIEIYYPSLTKDMAPVVSPMVAHGRLIKEQLGGDVKVVFLGPCIAKKREALGDERTVGAVDAVINFTEVEEWLKEEGIEIPSLGETEFDNKNPEVNRLYPITSGVLSSVVASSSKDHYRKFYVHGLRNCIELLKSMEKGEVEDCFIELNVCNGGCIKGPAVDTSYISRFKVKLDMEETIPKIPAKETFFDPDTGISLKKTFLPRKSKDPMPTDEQIRAILKKIGKSDPSHELNCGACGYSSCREKAIAVFQGKAELSMCIPYMHDKASSMANVVMDTTPNVIIMVDSDMKIVEYNAAAERYFHYSKEQALSMYLYEIVDHSDFQYVLDTKSSILGKKVTYKEFGVTTLQNIVYVPDQNNVLGIMVDITAEEEKELKAYEVKMDTIEMAQKVIDKQMMVAQEIAGLLGETTAETKVTLTKLRDTILYDGEEQHVDK
ncbi:MAG: [Fe-Fe] hydrogenase large subunit C-terminal domain-containing protein [bacterium]|nr:[Fe-Fe] hydrogenase large subunit C-terminal domain-containing protein [bacterium]